MFFFWLKQQQRVRKINRPMIATAIMHVTRITYFWGYLPNALLKPLPAFNATPARVKPMSKNHFYALSVPLVVLVLFDEELFVFSVAPFVLVFEDVPSLFVFESVPVWLPELLVLVLSYIGKYKQSVFSLTAPNEFIKLPLEDPKKPIRLNYWLKLSVNWFSAVSVLPINFEMPKLVLKVAPINRVSV